MVVDSLHLESVRTIVERAYKSSAYYNKLTPQSYSVAVNLRLNFEPEYEVVNASLAQTLSLST